LEADCQIRILAFNFQIGKDQYSAATIRRTPPHFDCTPHRALP
jgi:hypothetical protein